MTSNSVQTHRLYYGWMIVAVSFLTIFMALGTRYSFGVFYVAILDEFKWNRGEAAGAFSVAMLFHSIFAPISGYVIDKYGPRILFPIGACFLGVGLLLAGGIREMWHFYLFFGVLIAIGINTLSFSPHMSLIPRWFIKKRGLASGIVLAGMGMGSFVLAPFAQYLIQHIGWRGAFAVLGILILALVFPLTAIFQRSAPHDVGQYPDGSAPPKDIPSPPAASITKASGNETLRMRAVLLDLNLHLLIITAFSFGFCLSLAVVHQAARMVDAGFSPFFAASIVGVVGLTGSAGGIVMGFLSDRIGRKVSYAISGLLTMAGVLCLLALDLKNSQYLAVSYAVLFGFGSGSLSPIQGAAAGDFFGGPYLGRILSLISIGFGIGGALGSYLAGWLFDITGSYKLPFLLLLASAVISTAAFSLTKKR